jgi:hypothetical protein
MVGQGRFRFPRFRVLAFISSLHFGFQALAESCKKAFTRDSFPAAEEFESFLHAHQLSTLCQVRSA